MKDVEIKGHRIPKGWCVFAYFRSVHLDESQYDWPYQFNPWRWQVRREPFSSSWTNYLFDCSFFVFFPSAFD